MKKPMCSGYFDKKFVLIKEIVDDLLSTGEEHVCALDKNGTVSCWGRESSNAGLSPLMQPI